jgi:hypothetical protein
MVPQVKCTCRIKLKSLNKKENCFNPLDLQIIKILLKSSSDALIYFLKIILPIALNNHTWVSMNNLDQIENVRASLGDVGWS